MPETQIPLSIQLAYALPSFGFALYYFYRARKVSRFAAIGFVAIIIYAYFLETTDIRTMHSYFYRKNLVMLGTSPKTWVPLAICCSWASLIFIATVTSDRLPIKWWHRPWVDAMVAVSVDFVVDPVMSASRRVNEIGDSCYGSNASEYGGLGLWVWCVPEHNPVWLNVPIGNFIGWFLVVVVSSFTARLIMNLFPVVTWSWWRQLMIISVGTVIALGVLMALLHLYQDLPKAGFLQLALAALLLAPGLTVLWRARTRMKRDMPVDIGLVIMPTLAWFGGLSTLVTHGIDRPLGASLLLMTAAVCVSAFLLYLPYSKRLASGA